MTRWPAGSARWLALPPHPPQPRPDIDRLPRHRGPGIRAAGERPGATLEVLPDRGRDEPRAGRIHVTVAAAALLVSKEALRHDKMEVILGAGHRHIEQAALLLDLLRGAGGEVRRNAAVDAVEHENRFPLLP